MIGVDSETGRSEEGTLGEGRVVRADWKETDGGSDGKGTVGGLKAAVGLGSGLMGGRLIWSL